MASTVLLKRYDQIVSDAYVVDSQSYNHLYSKSCSDTVSVVCNMFGSCHHHNRIGPMLPRKHLLIDMNNGTLLEK